MNYSTIFFDHPNKQFSAEMGACPITASWMGNSVSIFWRTITQIWQYLKFDNNSNLAETSIKLQIWAARSYRQQSFEQNKLVMT